MDDKCFTDAIYQDLVDGLKTGDLNWTQFIGLCDAPNRLCTFLTFVSLKLVAVCKLKTVLSKVS